MTVLFHPEFPGDIRKYESPYVQISPRLAGRFKNEVNEAIGAIRLRPRSAGHLLDCQSSVVNEIRRRNLAAFPFFILYGITTESLIIGSLIPSRSDPLTWLARFSGKK